MPLLAYEQKKFSAGSRRLIDIANAICREYAQAGYDLTLRQLYYQFVARGHIANKQTEYKRLGSVINDARMAGQLDWDYIQDRTRNIVGRTHWAHPRDLLRAAANQFHNDYWEGQPVHVEVWVEKEALAGVIEGVTFGYDVTSFACRGYVSQSEQWRAARRLLGKTQEGKRCVIIHLGDHDPSGIDMTRDIYERIQTFLHYDLARIGQRAEVPWEDLNTWGKITDFAVETFHLEETPLFEVRRIALNMDQIELYDPPPNPAKSTDSRFASYEDRFGDESWELDALPPDVLVSLIEGAIGELMIESDFEEAKSREAAYRRNAVALLDEHGDVLEREI